LEAAGFSIGAAVEFDLQACATLRNNRPNWNLIQRDIHEVSSRELLVSSCNNMGEVDLLVGGPPCQPFSKSAYWTKRETKRLDDPRAYTLTSWLRILREVRPRAFLLENVDGLAYKYKTEGLRLLEDAIKTINKDYGTSYSFQAEVLNAADYGVPQVRRRAFIIGARDGTNFSFPAQTHSSPDELSTSAGPTNEWVTAWDALADLPEQGAPELSVTGKWARLLPSIPEGHNYLYHTDRKPGMNIFGWRTRYWSFLLKLAKDRPSWTIQAQPGSATGPFHWKNRRLSMRELCRLQTFPDDFEILGSQYDIQRQLGNAVPAALGELLGRAIRRQLLGDAINGHGLSLIPNYQRPISPREPIAAVPLDYQRLAGDHPAHPGEGKGPSGRQVASATNEP